MTESATIETVSVGAEIKAALEKARAEGYARGRAEVLTEVHGALNGTAKRRRRRKATATNPTTSRTGADPDASSVAAPEPEQPAKPSRALRERMASKKSKREAKSGDKRKSSWASMTDEQYVARVNAIRKGRGMPPMTAEEAAAKVAERNK